MELVFISAAFISGYALMRCHLPPLVGFLIAGFALHAMGYQSTPVITQLADLGVTLLLFTIGLKLDVKTLLAKEIWFGATAHNVLTTAFFTLALMGLKALSIPMLSGMSLSEMLLLGFALSFSSTVFAIKALQEKGELNATYGTLAIGMLIMQDIFAVIFLTATSGKTPELSALLLFGLPLLKPLLGKLLDKAGHGEILVLYAVFLALVAGAGLFEAVGIKPDLGALILGMLLASHPRASEMAKSLFNMKELFLVCFFLNIGLSEQPTWQSFSFALILMLLLPIKGVLYYWIVSGFRYRVRTALFTTLTLFNFSEFGLIVGGLAYKTGLMPGPILVSIAIAVSLSFAFSAPLNTFSNQLYGWASRWLPERAPDKLHPSDQQINLGDANILVLGMGRIGSGAYDELATTHHQPIVGIDTREDSVTRHQQEGRRVILGDATDPDFWSRAVSDGNISLILLAMPHSHANTLALEQIRQTGFNGKVAAIAKYQDELDQLKALGVDEAFNIYQEAGSGFARHVRDRFSHPDS
ncbi:cation:proton antiporter family protein [Salinivibrio kushneri]|uniref:cation:proton antiporter family protein n=1 Tax=Salinivibrio kushneri TaxID=1908198 RepID=UPI00098844E5|nr:cation:proton antiporter family protein [Salinivibrio kushneri]OOE55692.1 potassium transporter Kef [Salinivibrio kushneri]WBA18722.1 cation:proton antiporter [Salinivibrio kushneri]